MCYSLMILNRFYLTDDQRHLNRNTKFEKKNNGAAIIQHIQVKNFIVEAAQFYTR
jgi:hypothetical protein